MAALVWSAAYAAAGLAWAAGAPGFPYGRGGDPSAVITLFPDATPWPGGIVIALLGAVGAGLAGAVLIATRRSHSAGWATLPTSLIAFALIAIVPDYRVLLAAAYLPLIVLGAPFDWPPGVELGFVLPWPVLNQLILIIGGALWVGVAVQARRSARHGPKTSESPGSPGLPGSRAPRDPIADGLIRLGPPATLLAVAIPLVYAGTRFAWALGIPLGLSPELYQQGREIGLWAVGAGLASVAVAGAALTVGLRMRWGERFPGWLPFIGGRSVPVNLAVVPALAAAFAISSAGWMFVRLTVTGRLDEAFVFAQDLGWAALGPELLWPAWGAALALAALGYRERRRRAPRLDRGIFVSRPGRPGAPDARPRWPRRC